MNTKTKIAVILTSLFCLSTVLGGCSDSQGPVQTKEFLLADVNSILADYDGESVTVKKSDSDKIVVVEYMNKNKKLYFAKMELLGGVLTISEGARQIGNGVESYLELYLPDTYRDALSIHTTDGKIKSDVVQTVSSFHADTTNGELELSNLTADTVDLKSTGGKLTAKNLSAQICAVDTTNGETVLDSITGTIEYESKGGNLTINGGIGNGSFQVTGDGSLELAFAEVTGDITARTKNGSIALTLPSSMSFIFSAIAPNGSIQTSFSELLSATNNTVGGTIGENATVKIGLETKNGVINVTK